MSNINHVKVGKNSIGGDNPTYFIADIAANWDQSLSRAKDLIYLAAESGADAAKFQNFMADTIISAGSFEKWTQSLVIKPHGKIQYMRCMIKPHFQLNGQRN